MARKPTGITARGTTWQARVYDRRSRRKIYKTFPTMAAAKAWRSDAAREVRRGTMKAPTATTLRQAWDAWLAGAMDGSIRTRSGDTFKPSTVHSYEQSMNRHVLEEYGAVKLSDLTRVDLQDLAARLLATERTLRQSGTH